MLQEFLSTINSSVSNTAFTNPYGNGVNIPPQAVLGKMFKSLLGAFTGNPGSPTNTANFAQSYNGQNQGAAQAYANSLAGGQGFFGAVQPSKREAFSPGSIINSLQSPPVPQGFANPYGQLNTGINPLQGFAGQGGITAGGIPGTIGGIPGGAGGIPGGVGAFGAGNLGGFAQPGTIPGLNGITSGAFGKWSAFLMPLVGLLGAVKSFFGLRRTVGFMNPVQIDKEALDYKISLDNFSKEQNTDGSFDETYWDEGEGSRASGNENSFDESKLEM